MPEKEREETFQYGPYLQTAVICDKVLQEKDGVCSAIRIIDRITRTAMGPTPAKQMEPFTHPLALLLAMKAGQARGTYQVEIRPVKPNAEQSLPSLRSTVFFEGPDERGVNLVSEMIIGFDQEGLWWFDVYLNDRRITRIPLRIVYLPQPTNPPS